MKRKLKRKLIALICVFFAFCILISGVFVCYANTGPYLPTTPLYGTLNGIVMFSAGRIFTTGDNNYFQNDNYKYYYWCDYLPQYTADYTVTVITPKKMMTELYDSDNNLLARSDAPEDKNEDNKFVFSLTYHLEEDKIYYFKFAYTNGYFNSCGPFRVELTSGGGDKIPSDDYLHLFINNTRNEQVYDMYNYSLDLLEEQLSLNVVHKDGRMYRWVYADTHSFSLHGCDMYFDFKDCQKTVGKHKVVVHYMGYQTDATFTIVECMHEYEASNVSPTWLNDGCTEYKCRKCGDSYCTDYYENGSEMSSEFTSKLNSVINDDYFDKHYDFNGDDVINARDYKFLLDMYKDAENELSSRLNTAQEDDGYLDIYDMDKNGVIDDTDYSMLLLTI